MKLIFILFIGNFFLAQCIAFQKVWNAEGANFIAELKEQSLVPKALENIKYQLHLEMAQRFLNVQFQHPVPSLIFFFFTAIYPV